MFTEVEQERLIEKLEIFKIQGRDKRGRKILRIIGKFFPGTQFLLYSIYVLFSRFGFGLNFRFVFVCDLSARILSVEVVNKYLAEKVFPELEERPFAVVYVHTDVEKSENFPGVSGLRSFYDAIPVKVRENLEAVYFLHPGLQARLFLATFGRFIFSGG